MSEINVHLHFHSLAAAGICTVLPVEEISQRMKKKQQMLFMRQFDVKWVTTATP